MTGRHLLLHQVRLNQRSFWRNPESAFFNFAMPLGVLLIFGATSANDTVPGRHDVDVLTLFVPGILGFAIVVVAYGNLAATVALQRPTACSNESERPHFVPFPPEGDAGFGGPKLYPFGPKVAT